MPSDDAIERAWRRRRVAWYVALGALFAAIAFYFGPNVIMFGKLAWLSPADFVPAARRCEPVVRAMKAYERDHGRRPDRAEDLVPAYLPEGGDARARVEKGEFSGWTMFNHSIEYRFDAGGDEGWYVRGAYTNGRIPYPPVTIGPATTRATASTEPAPPTTAATSTTAAGRPQ